MNEELFEELLESVREAGAIERGETAPARRTVVPVPDVKKIRERMHLTQEAFAAMLGIPLGTVQNWEQLRRVPQGPARVLLQVAEKHPEALLDLNAPDDAEEVEAVA